MEPSLYLFTFVLFCEHVSSEIRGSVMMNKLSKVKPVGGQRGFIPLTEIPPPHKPYHHQDDKKTGRRHLQDDCAKKPGYKQVNEGPRVEIFGDYYEENVFKTVATIRIPEHIDRKHFEVTTQVPYLTVGTIQAIGYHPSTVKSEHPSECEKIYQDHLAEMYSAEESTDFSEESMEMARMPLFPKPVEDVISMETIYSDMVK